MKTFRLTLALAAISLSGFAADAAVNTLEIRANKPAAKIPDTMYGLFFEDINFAGDGGLYGEMLINRSFEFPQNLYGWKSFGKVDVLDDGPFDKNPHYIRLNPAGHRVKYSGLDNTGFFGVAVKEGEEYRFTAWARTPDGSPAKIRVELVDPAADEESVAIASQTIDVTSKDWTKLTAILRPSRDITSDGVLRIFLVKPDDHSVDLEHISLFPVNTWQGHENGLRRDLAQALADIKPGVFRFPGGCIVEGTEFGDRYQWKNTVGPVENRPLNLNRWQFEFPHRFYPDYYQSNGLGFYEYFLLSEEIGATPLPVLNVGIVCQYENPGESALIPMDSLQPYIDDAIDLIEFANGSTDTKWGKLRAEMGHPESFGLKYLAIGNEQWGPGYPERLAHFVKALREKHPEIKIVGSSGPYPDGEDFDYLWKEMRKLGVDLVDEHYYRNEDWFADGATRYDKYPRKGPKVFAGEYACHGKNHKKFNHYNASLMEAAFMTGLERNADIVEMATYAPLFAHEKGWQWRPDLIWYDNLNSHFTSSYFVQKLYSNNKGTDVIPTTLDGRPVAGLEGQNGLYATTVWDAGKKEYIVKIANISGETQTVNVNFNKLPKKNVIYSLTTTLMQAPADNMDRYYEAGNIKTTEQSISNDGKYTVEIPAESFAVYQFKVK